MVEALVTSSSSRDVGSQADVAPYDHQACAVQAQVDSALAGLRGTMARSSVPFFSMLVLDLAAVRRAGAGPGSSWEDGVAEVTVWRESVEAQVRPCVRRSRYPLPHTDLAVELRDVSGCIVCVCAGGVRGGALLPRVRPCA